MNVLVVLTVDVVKIVVFSCISDLVVGLIVVDVGGWKVVLILLMTCDDYIKLPPTQRSLPSFLVLSQERA